MRNLFVGFGFVCLSTSLALGACQPTVHVEPVSNWSSRTVEAQTRQSVIRDYIQSWQSLDKAFSTGNAGLLAHDFVGTARDQLAESIRTQEAAGISTEYCGAQHNIQIIFYSPEGLSIQLMDRVDYRMRVMKNGKPLATHNFQARYIAVLTPSATRWMVRIFQAEPQ